MIAAFAYLIFNTTRNRLQSQLRRLRTPRYAVGFALGLLYLWGMFFRHAINQPLRPADSMNPAAGIALETVAALGIAIVIAGIWIFGGDRSALAFSEAEVSMLFTAPVSRRALISYKLARMQLIILLNALIWTVILRRGSSPLPGALSAIAVWTAFTTLNLHRMGSALARASQVEYRAAGQKRKWLVKTFGFVVAITIMAALIAVPLSEIQAPEGSNPLAFMRNITVFLESSGVRTVLYPFHLVIAPVFAPTASAWAVAMLPALGIVLLHIWWVLSGDAAFEEAAALASTEQAKRIEAMRSRKTATFDPTTSAVKKTIALASTGLPATAIVWKNALALRRTVKPGTLLRVPILVLAIAALFGWKSGNPAQSILVAAAVMAVMTPIFGIPVLRYDLRSDMMHLPLLKSLPIAGADIVLAEVASGAVPLAAVQLVLLTIAGAAFVMGPGTIPISVGVRIGVFLALPVTLVALNGALCTILNGSAVLFPAWIRLGPAGAGGVEIMGQVMLTMIASFLAFILMLLIPTALAAAAWFVLSFTPAAAVTIGLVLGALALAAESYGLILALGHAFERAEPQQIT